MSDATLSVTIDCDDREQTELLLADLEPYRQGEIEQTRDFGATIAIATSIVGLVDAMVKLWKRLSQDRGSKGKTRPAVTVEARDGAVISLPEVRDSAEIERFVKAHAS